MIELNLIAKIDKILRNSQVGGSTYPIFFTCGALKNRGCSIYPGVRLIREKGHHFFLRFDGGVRFIPCSIYPEEYCTVPLFQVFFKLFKIE